MISLVIIADINKNQVFFIKRYNYLILKKYCETFIAFRLIYLRSEHLEGEQVLPMMR